MAVRGTATVPIPAAVAAGAGAPGDAVERRVAVVDVFVRLSGRGANAMSPIADPNGDSGSASRSRR